MADLKDVIEQIASGPASVSNDGGSVQQQSLADVIAADKYLNSKDSTATSKRGLRITKLLPPGPSGSSTNVT
jgi:hypothetical protein